MSSKSSKAVHIPRKGLLERYNCFAISLSSTVGGGGSVVDLPVMV
jgi:hypothetical protein